MKKFTFYKSLLLAVILMVSSTISAVTIAGWNVSGQSSYGTSPLAASTAATNVTVGSLTKGSGMLAGGTAASRAWGAGTSTTAWNTTSTSTAISNNSFFTFTVKPNSGYKLSLSALTPFDYRRSTNGAQKGLVQYQLNSGSFTDIATADFTSTSSSGASISSIDLSGISSLQNIPSTTTVTFRVVLYTTAGSGGSWYIYDKSNTTADDFAVTGTVSVVATSPAVTTPTSADVTSSSATLGGNITADGGDAITERGIYYSKTDGFADGAGTKVAATGTSTGVFTVSVTDLDASTIYYFKAYATNGAGTGYSAQGSFETLAGAGGAVVPSVSSPTSASVTATTAVLGGTITTDGGDAITERGIYWSTNNGFADGAGTKVPGDGTSTGVFTVNVSGLDYSTPYYYKAYATNGEGTGYSAQGTFTTATPTLSSPGTKSYTDVVRGTEAELKFTVSGTNLVANIGLEVSGTNADLFSISSSSVASGTEITLTYSPTAAGSHSATLTLSSTGASNVQVAVTGTTINPTLGTPVATNASGVNAFGFTANWDAVSNAESYSLNVYTKDGTPLSTVLSENFNGFSGGTIASPTSTDIGTSLNSYTQTSGWTGSKVYQAGGNSKMGTSSALGYITTPTINLSAESGNFTINVKAMAWNGDSKNLKIYLNGTLVHTITDLNNDGTTFKSYSIDLSGGTASSTIKFEGNTASNGRFFLEDLTITQGGDIVENQISGSPFTVAANAKTITGLSPASTYYYTVTASADGYTSSAVSNEKSVTTGKAYYRTADDGNWTSTSLWEYSADGVNWQTTTTVPGDNAKDVAIAKTVTVAQASDVSAAKVTINPDSKLTIDGTLTISDTITFISTDAGTAQLLVNEGTVTNNGVIKIRKTLLAASNWYFVSFPFDVTAANVFKTDGTQAAWGDLTDVGKDFYVAEYNGAKRDATGSFSATNSDNWSSLATHTMLANKGYIIGAPADITLDFVSSESPVTTIFGTTASETLSEHTVNALNIHHSWNLVGIPFSSSFDLINATQAQAPFYYYTGTQYETVMSDDSYQAYPFTSFFLQAKAGVNLEYATAGRLLKAASIGNLDEVNLVVKNAKYSDKVRVRMQDGALEGYDMGKDAVKMFTPKAEVPQIFSKQNGLDLSVNALPFGVAKVNVKVKVGEEGTYTVSLDDVAKAADCKQVTLVDNATGKETDLLAGEAYSFAGAANTTKSFTLLLSSNKTALSVPELPGDVGGGGDPGDDEETALVNGIENVSVYAVNRNIVVDASAGLVKSIGVYNVQGQAIATISAASAFQIIPISTAGSYIVKLHTDSGIKVQKVLVK